MAIVRRMEHLQRLLVQPPGSSLLEPDVLAALATRLAVVVAAGSSTATAPTAGWASGPAAHGTAASAACSATKCPRDSGGDPATATTRLWRLALVPGSNHSRHNLVALGHLAHPHGAILPQKTPISGELALVDAAAHAQGALRTVEDNKVHGRAVWPLHPAIRNANGGALAVLPLAIKLLLRAPLLLDGTETRRLPERLRDDI
mmetsp:Transcript_87787/g.233048  ORF Transcript_87787/g.233048 Transcript_87787/m.233048 type:complete len:203 (+) Transcript_87787:655-1263(+)